MRVLGPALSALAMLQCARDAGRIGVAEEPARIAPLPSSEPTAPPPADAPPTSAAPALGQPPPPPVSGTDAPQIEFVTRKTAGSYNAYVAYPKLRYEDAAVSAALNARVRRLVEQRERGFADVLRRDGPPDADGVGPHAFFAMGCGVAYASHALASIGCDLYEFAGGAHGTKGFVALNLAVPSLREVRASSVLRGGRRATATLTRLCGEALARAGAPDLTDALTAGEGEPPRRFTSFVITHDGLTFSFKDQLPFVIADAVEPHVSFGALAPVLRVAPAALVDPDAPFVAADTPLSPGDARDEEHG